MSERPGIPLGPAARVLFTNREHGNLSSVGGLNAQEGTRARASVCSLIGLEHLARGYQLHGTNVERVRELPTHESERAPVPDRVADGQATALADLGVMVMSADCLPVALACGEAVAMVHAGWRGLAAGVLEEGVSALRELSDGAGEIVAVIGPGAGPCCYEVGPEVHLAFDRAHAHGRKIDLRAIAHGRLLAAGVSEVGDLQACTICDERYFSHRREGTDAGRQAGITWLS
jgi:YfiH family protein